MYLQRSAFLSVLVALVTVACGPNDAGITTNVKANLIADETVKGNPIDVGVQKKVVTLTGTVDTPAVKERAVAVARKTDGVVEVVDQLIVKAPGFGPGHGHGPGHGREMMGREMKPGESKETSREEKHQ